MTPTPETPSARLRFRTWFPGNEDIEAHMDYNPCVGDELMIAHEAINMLTMDKIIARKCRVNDIFLNGVWMQSTGLKDRNGVEIFEGDIVKAGWGYGCPPVEVTLESFFYWKCESCMSEDIEVIGNRFQHPDLLPQKP